MTVELPSLGVESSPSTRDAYQRPFGGDLRRVVGAGPPPFDRGDLLAERQAPETLTDRVRRGVQQTVELIGSSGARLDGSTSSDSELPQRLDRTVGGLRCHGCFTGQ